MELEPENLALDRGATPSARNAIIPSDPTYCSSFQTQLKCSLLQEALPYTLLLILAESFPIFKPHHGLPSFPEALNALLSNNRITGEGQLSSGEIPVSPWGSAFPSQGLRLFLSGMRSWTHL